MGKKARDRSVGSLGDRTDLSGKVPRMGSSPPGGDRTASVGSIDRVVVGGKGGRAGKGRRGSAGGLVDEVEVSSAGGGLGGVAARGGSAGVSPSIGVRSVPGGGDESIRTMRAITSELLDVAFDGGLSGGVVKGLLGLAGRYEDVLLGVLMENSLLKGRLEVFERGGFSAGVPSVSGAVVAPSAPNLPGPSGVESVSKPIETWSVVVRSKDAAATPKDVVKKVVEEVAPVLDVRVHTVGPIKAGGAVIRTPSVRERDRIVANGRFGEVGLDVSVGAARAQRIVVKDVDAAISPAEFMEELFSKNLGEVMSLEEFRSGVRICSPPWQSTAGNVSVVLEGNGVAIDTLLRNDRCYIKWFAFRVRRYVMHDGCFKCFGYGHFARECRVEGVVCRRCGGVGHVAGGCEKAPSCRNCAFKGKPAGHRMMSLACPLHGAYVARVNSRH